MKKVLLLENIESTAADFLLEKGYVVELLKEALSEDELIQRIEDISLLGIRSKTMVTTQVLRHAKKLEAVGAFCIGTDHIDLAGCQENDVAVFNAPFSNTRSVAELALGEIIMLFRLVFQKSTEMHTGKWQKSSIGSHEVRGKTLGIVGYGSIGQQLSVLAEAIGMQVRYYDLQDRLAMGNARKSETLEELLKFSDIVTLHVDGRKMNSALIGESEISLMKDGALVINLSRGNVVDPLALVKGLESGRLRGAAIDVFPDEPSKNGEGFTSPLQGLPNVILTPHIAGSTVEAQKNIAEYVSRKLHEFSEYGKSVGAIVAPQKRTTRRHSANIRASKSRKKMS